MKKIYLTFLFALAGFTIFASTNVYTPALRSPKDDAINQMPNTLLDWDAVAGGLTLYYEAQIDTDSLFSNPVIFTTDLTSIENNELLFGQEYYWRVRAIDVSDTSYWSEVWSFTVFDKLTLEKPKDNVKNQMPEITFKWKNKVGSNDITGVSNFNYQIDTSSEFNSSVIIEGSVGDSLYQVCISKLFFGTKYYWRVNASHSLDVSEWSDIRSFTTLDNFDLISPPNEAPDQGIKVLFKWKKITGAASYDIQIDMDSSFTDPFKFLADTCQYNVFNLEFGKQYFWRVRARHDNDTSQWTDIWNFQVIDKVILSSPDDEATNVNIKPLLKWNKILGVTAYQLQYDKTSSFTEPIDIIIPTIDDNNAEYQIDNKLDYLQSYYWRVRAINTIDTTNWSDVWSFETKSASGINDLDFNKYCLNFYPNPSKGDIIIKFDAKESVKTQIRIMDLLGKVVFDDKFYCAVGQNTKKLDIKDLNNGIYLVKFQIENDIYIDKIIVDK